MEMDVVFIVGFVILGIYKLFELFVKKNERMALIEKLPAFLPAGETRSVINFPEISLMKKDYDSWPLRFSLLLIGVGLGCLLAFLFQYNLIDFPKNDEGKWEIRREIAHIRFVLYFSFIAVFGGLSLFIAYLIERKSFKKQDDSKK
ncbi:MAG: hypothetical protein LBH19_04715 [Dysgonamonadaceae bacterium]|jgi:hypothetical protein|nr:hypothetical protein [Dysgonamonadaceae bacterium]